MRTARGPTWTRPIGSALCTAAGSTRSSTQTCGLSIGRLLDDVRTRGDAAVCDALARFDGVTITPDRLRVTADEIDRAAVSPEVDAAIDDAISHITAFSEHQLARLTDWSFEAEPGLVVGEKLTPLASVGLFVPSGKASYPSVAYQLATPAMVAGVSADRPRRPADPRARRRSGRRQRCSWCVASSGSATSSGSTDRRASPRSGSAPSRSLRYGWSSDRDRRP